jgi:hypothetical protein
MRGAIRVSYSVLFILPIHSKSAALGITLKNINISQEVKNVTNISFRFLLLAFPYC